MGLGLTLSMVLNICQAGGILEGLGVVSGKTALVIHL